MFKIIKNLLIKDKRLEGVEDIPRWHSVKCYECGKFINPIECYHQFVEINGKQYAVPICDDCDTASVHEEPTNI